MTEEEVAREVRRLEITTRHLVRDIVAGEYSSAFRGRGVEFAEVREYQPDDTDRLERHRPARAARQALSRGAEPRSSW
jgi:hypothetical protein